MRTAIELQDPQNPGTYVEKRGRWCAYFENGELVAKNLSMSDASHLYFKRRREMKGTN